MLRPFGLQKRVPIFFVFTGGIPTPAPAGCRLCKPFWIRFSEISLCGSRTASMSQKYLADFVSTRICSYAFVGLSLTLEGIGLGLFPIIFSRGKHPPPPPRRSRRVVGA